MRQASRLFLLLVLASAAARADRLAVLDFKSKLAANDQADATYFADVVRSAALRALPGVQVITRENLVVLLQSTGRRIEDCEGECEVDTGRRIGADYVISGDLLRIGTSYKLNLRLHETAGGELLNGAVASGKSVDELDANTSPAVKDLLAPLHDRRAAAKAASANPRIEPEVQKPRGIGDAGKHAAEEEAGFAARGQTGVTRTTPEQRAAAGDKGRIANAPPAATATKQGPAEVPPPAGVPAVRKIGFGVLGAGFLAGAGAAVFALKGKSLASDVRNGGLATGADIAQHASDSKAANAPALGLAIGAAAAVALGAVMVVVSF